MEKSVLRNQKEDSTDAFGNKFPQKGIAEVMETQIGGYCENSY